VFFQDGRFDPGGFLHLRCRQAYFEGQELVEQLLYFSPDLDDAERAALQGELAA
jgi:hypothetical protein